MITLLLSHDHCIQRLRQGFMQDRIIASHTRFGGHFNTLTVKLVYEVSDLPDDLK